MGTDPQLAYHRECDSGSSMEGAEFGRRYPDLLKTSKFPRGRRKQFWNQHRGKGSCKCPLGRVQSCDIPTVVEIATSETGKLL